MANKLILTIIIIGIIALLVGGGIWAYFHFATKGITAVDAISSDGTASLKATFYDKNGNPIPQGTAQSFLEGNAPQIAYLSFLLQVRYVPQGTSDVDLNNLQLLSEPTDQGLAENLVKDSPIITTLPTSQITFTNFITTKKACTGQPDTINCDTKEKCVASFCLIDLDFYEGANVEIANLKKFATKIRGQVTTATGGTVNVDSLEVSLTYDIRGDTCADGTAYLACSGVGTPTPKQCIEFPVGSATKPILKDNAELCTCPSGYHVSGTGLGSTCVVDACTDPSLTPVSTCDTTPVGSLTTSLDANKRFCQTANSALIEKCTGLDGVVGGGDDCGCATDFQGGTGTCLATGLCQYPTYTGGLSGCIPDCLGKTIGSVDGCGGTCP